jgi:hypothetical protein
MQLSWWPPRSPLALRLCCAAGSEKSLEKSDGLGWKDSGNDFYTMVESRVRQEREAGLHRAAFGIFWAVDQSLDARLDYRPGAHGARLNGYVESGIQQAVVANGVGGGTQRYDFRMGRWVAIDDGSVSRARDNRPVGHDYCADRNLSDIGGGASFFECSSHKNQIRGLDVIHRIENSMSLYSALATLPARNSRMRSR